MLGAEWKSERSRKWRGSHLDRPLERCFWITQLASSTLNQKRLRPDGAGSECRSRIRRETVLEIECVLVLVPVFLSHRMIRKTADS
jgi:hypothetical protein